MQLRTLKISNILSFPYVSDLHGVSGMQFHTSEKGVTNILIGPNGTGKSTILEIINQAFKAGLVQDYAYDKTELEKRRNNNEALDDQEKRIFQKCILPQYRQLENLQKHVAYPSKSSQIYMEIVLNKNDYHNISLILEHRERLNSLIKKYSTMEVVFDDIDETVLYMHNILKVECIFDIDKQKVIIKEQELDLRKKFLFHYIKHHELIQICTHIFNKYERLPHEAEREPLKNTFALLGANRQFDEQYKHKEHITDQEVNEQIAHVDTKHHANGGLGYLLCTKKFREIIRAADGEVESLFEHQLFKTINALFKEYIGLGLYVKYQEDKVSLFCRTKSGHVFSFQQLSSGEQSFLLLILTVFGYDLQNGLMIIDEPELHLHPQTQRKFIALLSYLEQELDMQFIIATHSPLMVTPETVRHVLRCTKRHEHTHVINPHYMLSHDEANLVHMLQYENTAKMFFVDKIIMVEGETDQYFFSYYCEFLAQQRKRKSRINNYEIIDIGGKGSFVKRQKLLRKFGIETYYIGDRDNVLDKRHLDLAPYKKILAVQSHTSRYYVSHKTQKYGKLIKLMRDVNPQEYNELQTEIKKLYKKNTFLLQQGDLETYLGLRKKGLGPTVDFCRENFTERLSDKRYDKHRQEIEVIIGKVFR